MLGASLNLQTEQLFQQCNTSLYANDNKCISAKSLIYTVFVKFVTPLYIQNALTDYRIFIGLFQAH